MLVQVNARQRCSGPIVADTCPADHVKADTLRRARSTDLDVFAGASISSPAVRLGSRLSFLANAATGEWLHAVTRFTCKTPAFIHGWSLAAADRFRQLNRNGAHSQSSHDSRGSRSGRQQRRCRSLRAIEHSQISAFLKLPTLLHVHLQCAFGNSAKLAAWGFKPRWVDQANWVIKVSERGELPALGLTSKDMGTISSWCCGASAPQWQLSSWCIDCLYRSDWADQELADSQRESLVER